MQGVGRGAGGALTPVHVQISPCPTLSLRNGEQWKLCQFLIKSPDYDADGFQLQANSSNQ